MRHWLRAVPHQLAAVARLVVLAVPGTALFCATLAALVLAAFQAVHLIF